MCTYGSGISSVIRVDSEGFKGTQRNEKLK